MNCDENTTIIKKKIVILKKKIPQEDSSKSNTHLTKTLELNKPNKIFFYEKTDKYYEFSNFYESPITINGIKYSTTEHFYQSQKYNIGDKSLEFANIIKSANTPNKAFYLAQQKIKGGYAAGWYVSKNDPRKLNQIIKEYTEEHHVTVRSDWNQVKDNIMRRAVWAKFTQHPNLSKILIDTGDAIIYENSPRDSYWAIGADGKGLNMLGKILMEVRGFLQAKYPIAPIKTSNWIIPEYLLASAYPGDKYEQTHQNLLKKLVSRYEDDGANINVFISLQEPEQEAVLKSYRKVIAPNFIQPETPQFQVSIESPLLPNGTIEFIREPIPDRSIIDDDNTLSFVIEIAQKIANHQHMLIHCLGGKGRTGTIVGILLGYMYGMKSNDVLKIMADSFKTRVDKGKKKASMPQTASQFSQITHILSKFIDI